MRIRFSYVCPLRYGDLDDGACSACGKRVVDLSRGTEEDAARHARANPGACGRAFYTPDGRWIKRQLAQTAAMAALVTGRPGHEPTPPAVEPVTESAPVEEGEA